MDRKPTILKGDFVAAWVQTNHNTDGHPLHCYLCGGTSFRNRPEDHDGHLEECLLHPDNTDRLMVVRAEAYQGGVWHTTTRIVERWDK